MKRFLAIILVLVSLLVFCSCGSGDDSVEVYFIARVVQLEERKMLVEVTDKGDCGLSVGDRAYIPTEKILGVLENNPDFVTDNYIRVEFDGIIMDTYPLQLGDILKIDITDKNGISVE